MRKVIGTLAAALLFSLYVVLPYVGVVSTSETVARFAGYFIISVGAVLLLWRGACIVLPKLHCGKIEKRIYLEWTDQRFVLSVWGILIFAWLPAYLALFPGIFGYDTPDQMAQVLGVQPYSSRHPLVHTMILGFFLNLGKAVFGTYNGGVALCCAFQGVAVSGSISYSFLYMKRVRTPFPVAVVLLAWCIWYPVIQVLTFNTTKDILFGAVFLCFVIQCHALLVTSRQKSIFQVIVFIFTGVMCCLLRNQGIYIILALLILTILVNRHDRRFFFCLIGIAGISQLILSGTTSALKAQKGDVREMLSVPIQQMTAVCEAYMEGHPVNLTQEEFDRYTVLVAPEYMMDYQPYASDPIKSHFDSEALRADLPGYLGLYLSVGARNIGGYLIAFRCLVEPYWDVSKNDTRVIALDNTFPALSEEWGISQESLFPAYKKYLSDYIIDDMEKKLPVISWLLQPGLCIWVMTAVLGIAIAYRDKAVFLSGMAGMLFLGTLMLGPVALLRYLYPLTILTPWFLALLTNKAEEAAL